MVFAFTFYGIMLLPDASATRSYHYATVSQWQFNDFPFCARNDPNVKILWRLHKTRYKCGFRKDIRKLLRIEPGGGIRFNETQDI